MWGCQQTSQRFSKWGLGRSSLGLIWEPIRNADSCPLLQVLWTRNSGGAAQSLNESPLIQTWATLCEPSLSSNPPIPSWGPPGWAMWFGTKRAAPEPRTGLWEAVRLSWGGCGGVDKHRKHKVGIKQQEEGWQRKEKTHPAGGRDSVPVRVPREAEPTGRRPVCDQL